MSAADADTLLEGFPATLKLFTHVLQKGFEGGGLIGGAVVVPATAAFTTLYRKQQVDPLELLANAGISCLAGVGLSALLGSIKIAGFSREEVADRAYRLRYNSSQARNDGLAAVGAALGLAAAGYLLQDDKTAKPLHYLGGAGVGAASGVLLHMLTRSQEHRTPNKMLHELKT